MRAAAIALLLLLGGIPALAQTAEPKAGAEAQQMTRVLVLGDGIGGGFGSGLTRMGEADGHFDVTVRFNEQSGLARPEVYDWAETLPKILENNSYEVIVVLLGTNDRQMIRSGNARYAFGTPNWIAAYNAQTDRVLETLKASQARVYWVSIPPMADAQYDAAMRQVTALQKARAEAKGVTFVDIRPAFQKPDGSYTEFGPDDTGSVRKLRASDGIGFFKQGNNRLGQLVLEAIKSGTVPAAVSKAPESVAAPAPRTAEVPLFGQTAALDEVRTIRPEDVTVNAGLVLAAGDDMGNPAAVLAAIRAMVPKGSAAEKLFSRGETGDAPRGRADDFAAPPKPVE